MKNITEILTPLITLIGAIITYILVPFLKAKIEQEKRNNISFWTKVAVNAAEQIYAEKGQGKLKKEYVLNFLNNKGFELEREEEELNAIIEATVVEMNRAKEAWLE